MSESREYAKQLELRTHKREALTLILFAAVAHPSDIGPRLPTLHHALEPGRGALLEGAHRATVGHLRVAVLVALVPLPADNVQFFSGYPDNVIMFDYLATLTIINV